MKLRILLCGLLIGLFSVSASFSQTTKVAPKLPIDSQSKLINYTKVVEVSGTKSELFTKGIAWCNTFYKNPADVIREKSAEEGTILCKGRFKIQNPPNKDGLATDAGVIQYTLKLFFKDGKYKYEMTEFNWKMQSYYAAEKWMDTTSAQYKPEFDYFLEQLNVNALDILKDLDKGMKVSAAVKKDDW